MNNSHKGLILVFALVGLGGCALPGQNVNLAPSGNSERVETVPAVELLGQANVGEPLVLPSGNDLNALEATVLSEYDAASGKVCRRVELGQSSGDVRVICLGKDKKWTLTRVLDSQAFRQLTNNETLAVVEPVATERAVDASNEPTNVELISIVTASALDTESHLREVALGETLWKFSKRVTGNALNWNAIAEINQIDDARTVTAGMVLQVPAHLLRVDGQ